MAQLIPFLFVAALDASEAFYVHGLGLEVTRRQPDCVILAVGGDAYLGLCARPDAVSPDGLIVTLVVDDPARWHAAAVAAGGEEIHPVQHSERYEIVHSKVLSPDGHVIEFQRFDRPV